MAGELTIVGIGMIGASFALATRGTFSRVTALDPDETHTSYAVDHGIVERLSTGGRAAYFGLAPNDHHQPHPHFYCKNCGQMDCLNPESLNVDTDPLWQTFPGRIDKVEVRVDGVCKNCLKQNTKEN